MMEGAGSNPQALTAMDRARLVSQALSNAARSTRISAKTRGSFTGGGFQARRGARIMHLAFVMSFFLAVVVPGIAITLYYQFIASDQYVSEAKFSLTTGELPQIDSFGALTGLEAISVVQDTQIVTNYIASRAAVEALQSKFDLRGMYTSPNIDLWSRFAANKPIEKFVRYWEGMVDASISMPGGIVVLKVRAFSAADAFRIANAIIGASEGLVNDMNARMNKDAIASAEQELQRASARLTKARLAMEQARNEGGLLDAGKAGDALQTLITNTRVSLLGMQRDYATNVKLVSANAPQMRVLKDRIDTTNKQVAELEAKLTSDRPGQTGLDTISSSMRKFSELDLERQIAERIYAGSAAALEVARIASEQKHIYLNSFVRPSLPEEAQYPRRFVYPILATLILFVGWGLLWGMVAMVRNHMA
jgi:capsular polysaccharide transport system permease protein